MVNRRKWDWSAPGRRKWDWSAPWLINGIGLSIILPIVGVIGLVQGHFWLGLFFLMCGIATAFTWWVVRG